MKKPSICYTCYGICYCDYTLWWMLGEFNTKNLLNTLLNLTSNNMTIALLPSSKRKLFASCYLNYQILGIGHSHHPHPYLLFDNFNNLLASPFSHKMVWCLHGCKFEWCPCFLGGHNICEHHMYLHTHTHKFFYKSYMPRWILRGGGGGGGVD
jgi:hypothetical protein